MIGWIILAVLFFFLAVILIRTIRFQPEETPEMESEEIAFNRVQAVENLRQLLTCRTISNSDHSLEDEAEFNKLVEMLPGLYPNVFRVCKQIPIPDHALFFRWEGAEKGEASVLLSHYDVVPVEEEHWEKDPFGGIIENGVLWGRGAIDNKATLNGVLSAADHLIAQGFQPKNDIYFAFSGGEEVSGNGAVNIVKWFEDNGIKLAMVLDEGGAVVEGVFPGVQGKCGLVGIAEKGLMNLEYSVHGGGGHASAPSPNGPVVRLAKACAKVTDHPFKAHFAQPIVQMFDILGRRSTPAYRVIFANLWCFGWILDLLARKSGGNMNALLRTTVAFTQMDGSMAANVIPPEAKMVSNIRINPADSVKSVVDSIKKKVNDDSVEIKVMEAMEPSPISRTDCEGYARVKTAIEETWEGTVVAPYLMVQCSDSRHYGRISDRVYRFSAQDMTGEEMSLIHGNNERIRTDAAQRTVEFYIRLMKKC